MGPSQTPGSAERAPTQAEKGRAVADRDDFDTFVGTRSTALLRTAFLLTHDRGLAEDLVQTALAKAWFAWGRIEGNPETYVRRILVNTYASWWRRKWNGEQATEQLPESAPGQSPAAAQRHAVSGQVEDRTDLWEALGRLPKRQRAVVVLRFYEDLSEIETAELMQCSVGTVKSQASRALAKLRLDPALHHDEPTTRAGEAR